MGYRPGDFYRICERTGFKVLASTTRKEWTGRIVRRESYERRQPQDFVRGVTDRQVVDEPRPEGDIDNFVGPLVTTLAVAAAAGAISLVVHTTARMIDTDKVGLLLDNGDLFRTSILSVVDATHLLLVNRLPNSAGIGNVLTDYSATSIPSF